MLGHAADGSRGNEPRARRGRSFAQVGQGLIDAFGKMRIVAWEERRRRPRTFGRGQPLDRFPDQRSLGPARQATEPTFQLHQTMDRRLIHERMESRMAWSWRIQASGAAGNEARQSPTRITALNT